MTESNIDLFLEAGESVLVALENRQGSTDFITKGFRKRMPCFQIRAFCDEKFYDLIVPSGEDLEHGHRMDICTVAYKQFNQIQPASFNRMCKGRIT